MPYGVDAPSRRKPDAVIASEGLAALVSTLVEDGYVVIAPRVRESAIILDRITTADSLPCGVSEVQAAGRYRLRPRSDNAVFAYAAGPNSPKNFLRSPEQCLYRIVNDGGTFRMQEEARQPVRMAFIGLRACDLAAVRRQDQVLAAGVYPDVEYSGNRAGAFFAAVECGHPSDSCFCSSWGIDTRPAGGYDLLLTELLEKEHRFAVWAGSPRGEAVLSRLPGRPAAAEDLRAAERVHEEAKRLLTRQLNVRNLREDLTEVVDDRAWEAVASRCLACGNCTEVCPTCFCTTIEDSSDVSGETAERWRRADSCFSLSFSYIHGGSVRTTVAARYRQWVMHKFVFWWDQFGASGCVGCGRCITWCPAGLDLTREVELLRAQSRQQEGCNGH